MLKIKENCIILVKPRTKRTQHRCLKPSFEIQNPVERVRIVVFEGPREYYY